MTGSRREWLSVVMPTYNGAHYLAETLESLCCQTQPLLEVIAVDDGSSDETVAILRRFQSDLPLRVIERHHTGNWVANTNEALAVASGEYLSILHQDDLWACDRVEGLAPIAERWPDSAMIFHPVWLIDGTGERVGRLTPPLPQDQTLVSRKGMLERLLVQNFISVPAIAIRRTCLPSPRPLDEGLWYTADWKLWLQLSELGDSCYVSRPLASFRVHGDSLTVRGSRDRAAFRRQLEVVLEEWLGRESFPPAVVRAAKFSITVNVALAAAARGRPGALFLAALRGLSIGWPAMRTFWEYSRVGQRAAARLRAGLARGRRC
jgi:glycosyltransferase involved in cell wall biosynthesis